MSSTGKVKEVDFGFLFCRMVRFYGMSPDEVRRMPIRQFWFMNSCVERLRAEENLRDFAVANRAQGGEGTNDFLQGLREQMGNFFVIDKEEVFAERDEAGVTELKMLQKAVI